MYNDQYKHILQFSRLNQAQNNKCIDVKVHVSSKHLDWKPSKFKTEAVLWTPKLNATNNHFNIQPQLGGYVSRCCILCSNINTPSVLQFFNIHHVSV